MKYLQIKTTWPEPRHSDTLTVSDGFGGLK